MIPEKRGLRCLLSISRGRRGAIEEKMIAGAKLTYKIRKCSNQERHIVRAKKLNNESHLAHGSSSLLILFSLSFSSYVHEAESRFESQLRN